MKNVVAVRRWATSRAVVIPRHIQRLLSWRVGDVLHISVENNTVVLRPIELPKGVKRPEASDTARAGA